MAGAPARLYCVLCVVFGASAIALLAWLASATPRQACGGMQSWATPPFLAYQLSRTHADIEALFGHEGDPCRTRMIAALDLANKFDLIVFATTYHGFLACFFLALWRYGYPGLAQIGLISVVATFSFGVLEAAIRLYITATLPGSLLSITLLGIADTGKYFGLAGAGASAGAAMLARGGGLGRLAGIICIVGAFMVALGLNYFPARAALTLGFGIVWLVMLLYAAVSAVERRGPAR